MSHVLKNIKTSIVVFSLFEILVNNHFFIIFNTSPISNSVNTICIYEITLGQSGPIPIIFQPKISGVGRNVFHTGNGDNYGARED